MTDIGKPAATAAAGETQTASGDEQEQDFSAAFAEAATKADDERNPEADDAAGAADPEKDAGKDQAAGAAGQPRNPDGRYAPKTGAQPGADKAAAAGTQGAAPATDGPDIWKDAPEPLRAAHNELERRNSGLSEQIRRRNQQNDTLTVERNGWRDRARAAEEKLKQFEGGGKQPAAAPAGSADKDPAGDKPAGQKQQQDLVDDEAAALAKLADEFPDFAPLINRVKRLDATEAELKTVKDELAAVKGREKSKDDDSHATSQFRSVTSMHPDWLVLTGHEPDEVADLTGKPAPGYDSKAAKANSERFAAWLNAQPDYVRNIIKQNGSRILDAEAVNDVLDRYKAHLAKSATPAADPQKPAAPAQGDGSQKPAPAALPAKRQAQLQGSTSVPNRGPAPVPDTEDDFSSAFKSAAAKATKEIRAR